jgi:hypothetical protein
MEMEHQQWPDGEESTQAPEVLVHSVRWGVSVAWLGPAGAGIGDQFYADISYAHQ